MINRSLLWTPTANKFSARITVLKELVREADIEWGRVLGERPHFEKEGSPPHPEDCYTVESVRGALSELIKQLDAGLE